MTLGVEATCRAYAQVLLDRYPTLDPTESQRVVLHAYEAVALFELLSYPDADELWFACAEREVRLRLGIDVEERRLDPQSHLARCRAPALSGD